MKRTLPILLAVLLFASANLLAQDPTTTSTTDPTNSGSTLINQTANSTSTLTKYALSDAYPLMKKLENQPILLVGKAEMNAKIGVWLTLVDGAYKIPVIRDFKELTSTAIFGKQVMLTGAFKYDVKAGWRFIATGVKVL